MALEFYTLESFYDDCRKALRADPEAGQEKVRQALEQVLADPRDLHKKLEAAPKADRVLLYRDPETDMHVFAHFHLTPGGSKAHDHGPCWIIYGNLTGVTDMTEFRRLDDGSQAGKAKLEESRRYRVGAGEAVLFKKGAIHETAHPPGRNILVRVISGDMDKVWRHTFDPATGTVKDRPPRPQSAA
jgi:hypothetical protein